MKHLLALVLCLASLNAQIIGHATSYGKYCNGCQLYADPPTLGTNPRGIVVTPTTNNAIGILGISVVRQTRQIYRISAYEVCYLHIVPISQWMIPISITLGYTSIRLGQIPNDANLIGLRYYMQAAVNTPYAPSWSNGIALLLGR